MPRAPEPTWPALERGTFRTPSAASHSVTSRSTAGRVRRPASWRARRVIWPDHIALSVTDLDLWLTKLRREGVAIVQQPRIGDTRTLMVEGPSREVIELVEIKAPGVSRLLKKPAT